MEDLKTAIVIAKNETVQVYKQVSTGLWINYQDCTTTYSDSQLKFI